MEVNVITKALEQWNGDNKSIIRTIKRVIWPSERSIKEAMLQIIHKLDVQFKKLQQISSKLKKRDEEFFEKCVEAQLANDRFRAVMYANECAEIRKMAQIVLSSELAIEKAMIRFQTIGELDDVLFAISPVASIIQDIKGKLVDVIPSVANRLEEVNLMLGEAIQKTGNIKPPTAMIKSSNKEATSILTEANRIAEGLQLLEGK
jgi:division protein CdvB (Snf7/Vps24/ESCRT-III family)